MMILTISISTLSSRNCLVSSSLQIPAQSSFYEEALAVAPETPPVEDWTDDALDVAPETPPYPMGL